MKNSNNKRWLLGRSFYTVVASLVILIIGTGFAIVNYAKIKKPTSDIIDKTSIYTVEESRSNNSDSQANLNATGIPDERTKISKSTTEKSTMNDLNRPYSGYFLFPINSSVSKDYSGGDMVFSKTMQDWRVHNGIDISGNKDEKVVAIQDGKVTAVYTDDLWGETIEIQHGNGLKAKYCGVKSNVKADQKVEQGQLIGTLSFIPIEGEDGYHVHLETTVDEKIADPVKALNCMNEPISEIE